MTRSEFYGSSSTRLRFPFVRNGNTTKESSTSFVQSSREGALVDELLCPPNLGLDVRGTQIPLGLGVCERGSGSVIQASMASLSLNNKSSATVPMEGERG